MPVTRHAPPGKQPPCQPTRGQHGCFTLQVSTEMMIRMEDMGEVVIVAVPFDAVNELECQELAFELPNLRGAVLDAVVAVGMDSAALVTLLQAPDSVRAFAAWVRNRCERSGDSIELMARRGNRRVRLTVDGNIDVKVVADFLAAAFAENDPQR